MSERTGDGQVRAMDAAESLLPRSIANAALIPLALIDEHPDNPRVATWDLDELVASIRRLGVQTPCTVRPIGDRFQLIAGHRRKRAAELAGVGALPCIVRQVPDDKVWTLLLAENVQRRDLNPVEEARAYQRLREGGATQQSIAVALGISEQRVSRRLALLDLSEQIQALVLSGKISMAEAWDMARQVDERRKGPKPGQGGRNTKRNEHFNSQHSLARAAAGLCDGAGHSVALRLGPACAACWEYAVRVDQRAADLAARGPAVEMTA